MRLILFSLGSVSNPCLPSPPRNRPVPTFRPHLISRPARPRAPTQSPWSPLPPARSPWPFSRLKTGIPLEIITWTRPQQTPSIPQHPVSAPLPQTTILIPLPPWQTSSHTPTPSSSSNNSHGTRPPSSSTHPSIKIPISSPIPCTPTPLIPSRARCPITTPPTHSSLSGPTST